VLCHLEGLTNEEAARQLGCPKGPYCPAGPGSARLRTRLARRRASARLGLLTTLFLEKTMAGPVPARLVHAALSAAVGEARGGCGVCPGGAADGGIAPLHDRRKIKLWAALL